MLGLVVLAMMATAGDDPPARLRYEAPPTCPPRDVVVAALAAQLGRDPFVVAVDGNDDEEEEATVEVSVVITTDGDRHRGVLTVGGEGAAREFVAGACASVVAAAAVAAALALDPGSAFADAPPPEKKAPQQPSPLDAVEPPPEDPVSTLITVAPFAELGSAPGVGFGVVVGAGVRRGAFSLSAEGRVTAPRGVQVGDDAFVDVVVAGGDAVGCGHLDPVALCAVAFAADYVVTGRGLDDARTDHALVAAVGPRVSVDVGVGDVVVVGAFVEVTGVVVGTAVASASGAPLFQTAPVFASGGLRLGARF